MYAPMDRSVDYFEILGPVVSAVMVDVMYGFVCAKRPAQHLFHYDPMFKPIAKSDVTLPGNFSHSRSPKMSTSESARIERQNGIRIAHQKLNHLATPTTAGDDFRPTLRTRAVGGNLRFEERFTIFAAASVGHIESF